MKHWEKRAIELLHKSLKPIPQELNELDWKSKLSDNSEKLAQHLSAFANQENGGVLVFGMNELGKPTPLSINEYQEIIKKLGNIARENLDHALILDHKFETVEGSHLLFIYIQESQLKPVYLRGKTINDSYIRSSGQTRKMSKQEIQLLIKKSSGTRFEEEIALFDVSDDRVLNLIDYVSYFELMGKNLPANKSSILDNLLSEKLIYRNKSNFDITNLGAILFAKSLKEFDHLSRKAVRVIFYEGNNRIKTIKEHVELKGYANGFEGLITYISEKLPHNEVIGKALRKEVKMYPELAIRELVANAIIHQDFYATGTSSMVEIFSDRIEITNPGKPIINIMRFIDSPPQSRNEILASFMRRLNICEERGSGIDKVIFEIELYQLPAPYFVEKVNHTIVTLYSQKQLSEMDKSDKIRACYQHCCLKYVSNEKISNQSLRHRFNISNKNYPMASRIIAETLKAGLIKPADPESMSKKYAYYLPFWA